MPSYAFNPYAVPMAVAGTTILAIGILVSFRRDFDRLGFSFLLVCLSSALWLFGFTGAYLAVEPRTAYAWDQYVSLLGVMWIPSTSYLFSVALGDKFAQRRGPLAVAMATSAFFTSQLFMNGPWMLERMRQYFFGYYSIYGPGMKYFILAFGLMMEGCLAELYFIYRDSTSGIERKQTLWVFLGFLVASLASVDYLPGYGIEIYPIGYLGILAFAAIFAYAIEVYRLMDVQTALLQTASYLLTVAILFLPILAFMKILHPLVLDLTQFKPQMIFSGLLAGSIVYWKWAEKRLGKLFQRTQERLRGGFDQIIESFRYSLGLRETVEQTVTTLVPLLDLYHMSYWQLEGGGGAAKQIASLNIALPASLELPAVLRQRLAMVKEVQELRDLPTDVESKAFLINTQAALVLPIQKGDGLLGFFVLGPKRNLHTFKAYELSLLNNFRERMGEALSNAVLTDQFHEMANQVMLVEKRTLEVEKVKAQFLEAVSHEIRTPLATISGFAEVMAGKPGSGHETRAAQIIQQAATRIGGLVADMIRAASLERESIEVSSSWFDFAASCEKVLTPFRKKISMLRFTLELSEQPFKISADKDKLEDILFRLLSNAVKYSPPEGEVLIWGRRAGTEFECGVQDQGPGLSEDARKNLFEKFNRPYDGPDEVNLKNPGSGLGLYIVKTLVDMQRGKVFIDPSHRGCRVVIRLPQPTNAQPGAVSA